MKQHKSKYFGLLGLLALALVTTQQGCGDDNDNDSPDPVIPIDEGGSSSGGKGSGGKGSGTAGKTDNGGSGETPTEGGTGATATEGGHGNEGGDTTIEPPACTLPERGPNDCYNCPKDGENEQWLNRCVDGSKCEPFDNQRVKLLNEDGSLPPFPT